MRSFFPGRDPGVASFGTRLCLAMGVHSSVIVPLLGSSIAVGASALAMVGVLVTAVTG